MLYLNSDETLYTAPEQVKKHILAMQSLRVRFSQRDAFPRSRTVIGQKP